MYSRENEPFIVRRAVKAVTIPAGVEVNLKVGSVGYITQALGGSFTVYIDGSLFRIAGSDADSIDKEMAKPPEVPPSLCRWNRRRCRRCGTSFHRCRP